MLLKMQNKGTEAEGIRKERKRLLEKLLALQRREKKKTLILGKELVRERREIGGEENVIKKALERLRVLLAA